MLEELVTELANAKTDKEKEKAFRQLERVGVDRLTARVLVEELRKEKKCI